MLFDPNANDPIDKSHLSLIGQDLLGMQVYASWEHAPYGTVGLNDPPPNALPVYHIFPMNGSPQQLSFMQNHPSIVKNIGWSHELLLRALIHNLEQRVPHPDPTIGWMHTRAVAKLSEALSELVAAQALTISAQEQLAHGNQGSIRS